MNTNPNLQAHPELSAENPLRELVVIIFMQRRLILWVFATIMTAVVGVLLFSTTIYQIDSTLLMKSKQMERSPENLDTNNLRMMPVREDDLNSEVQILTSMQVLDKTRDQLLASGLIPELSDEEKAASFPLALASALKTQVVPGSQVIRVGLTWPDRDQGSLILSTVLTSYLDYRNAIFKPDTLKDIFTQQTASYSQKLDNSRAKKLALIEQYQAADPSLEIEQNLSLLKELSLQRNALEQRAQNLAHQHDSLAQALEQGRLNYFSFLDNATIRKLATELQILVTRQTELERTYLPQSPPAAALREQIDLTYDLLKEEIRTLQQELSAQRLLAQQDRQMLIGKMEAINQRNIELQQVKLQLDQLDQEIGLLSHSYETFYKRREEAEIQNQFGDEHLSVVVLVEPQAQLEAKFPRWKTMLPLGMLIALLTSICLGFINEFFDHSFKRVDDSPRQLGLPTLLSLPKINPSEVKRTE